MRGWNRYRFGDFAEFPPPVKIAKGEKVSFIPMEVLTPGQRFVHSKEAKEFKGSGARFCDGDTLFARITPCLQNGKIAQARLVDKAGFGSTEYFVFRGKEGVSDSDFIFYLSLTPWFREVAELSMVGASGRQRADAGFLSRLELNVPPLPIQQKIAGILSAYDELIENNLKRIKLLEGKAQQTYEEWFVRMRFPGHESTPIDPDTGLPEGWEEQDLGDVSKMNVASLKKGFRGNIRYIDISSVGPGVINGHEKFDFAEAPGRARRKAKHGDTIWSCVRPNRKSHALVWSPHEDDVFSTGFCVISPEKRLQLFVHFELKQDRFVDFLMNRATGAAYPAVKQKDFLDYPISIPAQGLVDAFDDEVRPIADFCSSLKSMNTALEEARDILLPRLMTGMIDVEELDVELPMTV